MKIISWNVNGLRAVLKKNFLDFITTIKPDMLGIQETKLQLEQIPKEFESLVDYQKYWSFAEKKGYSGTCLLSKPETVRVSYDIGSDLFNGEGRIIQAEYDDFILFNIYYPNGQMNDERLQYKLDFYNQFLIHVEKLRKLGNNIIAMGDFNTAHKEIDLANPKENSKYSGFLPVERQWIDKFIENGFVDTFRHFDKSPESYSWWSYRAVARARNIGWRIDYVFVNEEFLPRVKKAFILDNIMGSDHCPVGIELK